MPEKIRPALVQEEEARTYLGGVSRAMIYKLRAEGLIRPIHPCAARLDSLSCSC